MGWLVPPCVPIHPLMVGYGFPLVSICFPIAFDGEGGLRSRCSPSLYRTMPPFKEKIETQRKAIEKEMENTGNHASIIK